MTLTTIKPQKRLMHKAAIFALGLSAAALLSACGGGHTEDTSTEVTIDIDDVASAEDGLVTLCPDDKILASDAAYNAIIFPNPDGDYKTWHAENGKRDDVITTPSGLQYKTVQAGLQNGASPVGNEVVTVHYHGYFPNGDVFDSSYNRGQTIKFPANGVIPGWVEALTDMKTCEARTLYIPGNLAYGPQGRPSIPPNATLLFNVQLIGVNKK